MGQDKFLKFVTVEAQLRDGFNVNFMQKRRKWTARLPLSAGCFLIALKLDFLYVVLKQ